MVNTFRTINCKICGEKVKDNLTFLCTCGRRVCENCWNSVMCNDCFDKLPYDKKKLVENFDEKFKKRRKIFKIMMYIMFFSMFPITLIFHLPFWTFFIEVGFMIVFSILFYFIPLIRFNKSLKNNYT